MVYDNHSPFFESQKRHGKHLFAAPIRPRTDWLRQLFYLIAAATKNSCGNQ